jgi:hypothetical protein
MGPRVQLTDWQFDYQFHCDLHPGPNPEPKIVVQTGCPTAKVPMSIATEIPIKNIFLSSYLLNISEDGLQCINHDHF